MHVSPILFQGTLHVLLSIKQSEGVPGGTPIGKPHYQHTVLLVLDRRVLAKEVNLKARKCDPRSATRTAHHILTQSWNNYCCLTCLYGKDFYYTLAGLDQSNLSWMHSHYIHDNVSWNSLKVASSATITPHREKLNLDLGGVNFIHQNKPYATVHNSVKNAKAVPKLYQG